MALLLIAVTWMLLAAIVVGLCRAARLGEAAVRRPPTHAVSPIEPEPVGATVSVHDARIEASRRLGVARGPAQARRFTKSSRRRAGLHRA